jgi:hypothetical protein
MKMHILPCLFAAVAIGGVALWSPAAEMRAEADPIDFANLHSQATSAMNQLQVSQERRMALLQTGEFEF